MMNNNLASIKTRVRELRPYSLRPDRARVKLNQNENPWDTPSKIKQETLKRLSDGAWSRYPNFVPQRLRERLAEFSGWTADGIVAGNGSNELIQALLMVTVGEGKRVLISEPTSALQIIPQVASSAMMTCDPSWSRRTAWWSSMRRITSLPSIQLSRSCVHMTILWSCAPSRRRWPWPDCAQVIYSRRLS